MTAQSRAPARAAREERWVAGALGAAAAAAVGARRGASLGMSRLVFTGWRGGADGGASGVERLPAEEETSRLGAGVWPLMNMFLSFVARTSVRVFAGVFAAARTCVAVGDARESELVVEGEKKKSKRRTRTIDRGGMGARRTFFARADLDVSSSRIA